MLTALHVQFLRCSKLRSVPQCQSSRMYKDEFDLVARQSSHWHRYRAEGTHLQGLISLQALVLFLPPVVQHFANPVVLTSQRLVLASILPRHNP